MNTKNSILSALDLARTGESPAGEAPVVLAVDRLFELALVQRASDIHLEPQVRGLFVRFRVDGMLRTIHEYPITAAPAIVSRIKIMASMDIAEKRLPQDGQIRTQIGKRDIELRISTLPGKYGEKVVIRVLDKTKTAINLGELDMNPLTQSRFEMAIDKPQGIILVTGPTGSGKTTTLYSALSRLRSPMLNIITLEDPIEYELLSGSGDESGVTQVQMNPKIGLTFATSLRASLRQDPDVIMLGEIRDKETAETAMRASMTGHLVFSTLHTNGAPDTISRLRDIGVDAYLVASTLNAVMAQRLMRLLCPECKEPYTLPARMMESLFAHRPKSQAPALCRPRGCEHCQETGYWGRQGIFELLLVSEEIKQLIMTGARTEEVCDLAKKQGMATLRQSGLELVYRGLTTVDEVFRNTVE